MVYNRTASVMKDRTIEQWIAEFHGFQFQGVDLVCVMCGLRLCLKRVRFVVGLWMSLFFGIRVNFTCGP